MNVGLKKKIPCITYKSFHRLMFYFKVIKTKCFARHPQGYRPHISTFFTFWTI